MERNRGTCVRESERDRDGGELGGRGLTGRGRASFQAAKPSLHGAAAHWDLLVVPGRACRAERFVDRELHQVWTVSASPTAADRLWWPVNTCAMKRE